MEHLGCNAHLKKSAMIFITRLGHYPKIFRSKVGKKLNMGVSVHGSDRNLFVSWFISPV